MTARNEPYATTDYDKQRRQSFGMMVPDGAYGVVNPQ